MTDCARTAPRSNSHLPLRLSLVKFWPWSRSGSLPEEVTAILGVLADLNVRLRQIHELLKEEFGGEEEAEENGP